MRAEFPGLTTGSTFVEQYTFFYLKSILFYRFSHNSPDFSDILAGQIHIPGLVIYAVPYKLPWTEKQSGLNADTT
jgi:hypothetical protein